MLICRVEELRTRNKELREKVDWYRSRVASLYGQVRDLEVHLRHLRTK